MDIEGFRFRYLDRENKSKDANNLVRGVFSSYLGIVGSNRLSRLFKLF